MVSSGIYIYINVKYENDRAAGHNEAQQLGIHSALDKTVTNKPYFES